MYQTIDEEFVDEKAQSNDQQLLSLNSNQEREIFTTSILSKFLNEKKLKEIETITDRVKYKRHLIEQSTKELKKEKKATSTKLECKNETNRKKLSKRLKKKLGIGKLDTSQSLNYADYLKLNEAWITYAASCLLTCLPKASKAQQNVAKEDPSLSEETALNCLKQLDYHGCKIRVVRSTNSTLVGLTGIILQDKKNVFFVLSEDNQVKIIAKNGNLFEFELLECKFTLVGANMMCKPEMRVTKHAKIKTKVNIR